MNYIAAVLHQYYSVLYTADIVLQENIDFVLTFVDKTLTHEQAQMCDAPFTVSEVIAALDSLPINKSPGLDGFTSEFYKCFFTSFC